MRILLVEDSAALAANIGEFLTAKGHCVDFAADGLTGLHLCAINEYDAIVLDLMLPGIDGITLCRRVRRDAADPTPILMLTARDTLEDKLTGLEAGADDYLVKPFELRELDARLAAITRRGRPAGRRLRVADLSLDLDTLQAERAGIPLNLTPSALRLLEVLMKASPAVVTRDALERALWGDSPPASDALRLHIHGLRATIDRDFATALLRTVRGRGWALSAPGPDAP
jgi:DNA-binding response OmpR family regulator